MSNTEKFSVPVFNTPAHETLLQWLKDNGIQPELAKLIPEYVVDVDNMTITVPMWELDENGHKQRDAHGVYTVIDQVFPIKTLPSSVGIRLNG